MPDLSSPIGAFTATLSPAEAAAARALQLRSLAAWAYIHLLPGFLFLRQRSEFIQGWELAAAAAGKALEGGVSAGAVGVAGAPALGSWMMLPHLTDARTQTVLPMNDALYGAAQVELDRPGPVVIGVPANLPDGRYYSVAILDAFMNNVAHLGPRWTGNESGEHLLVGPDWSGPKPDWAAGVIRCPTTSTVLFHRVLVSYEPGDIDVVRAWRDGFTLTPLAAREGTVVPAPDTADLVHGDLRTLTDPTTFFRLAVEHARRNPPPVQDAWLMALLTGEQVEEPTDAADREAVADGVRDGQLILDGAISTTPRRDGWDVPSPHIGLPGPYVVEQAITQLRAIGANDASEAMYFFADRDTRGEPLDASDGSVYELRFDADRLPPVEAPGFWSVTMYKASDGLLVANALDRFSTRLTRPGFSCAPDGAATIVFASAQPRGIDEANWLPAPADEPFMIGLRLYYPADRAQDGTWFPPAIVRR